MRSLLPLFVLAGCAKSPAPPPDMAELISPPPDLLIDEPIVATTADGSSGDKTPWPPGHVRQVHGWLAIGGGLLDGIDHAVLLTESSLSELSPPGELASQSVGAVREGGPESITAGEPTELVDCTGTAHTALPIPSAADSKLEWIVSPTFSDAEELPITITDSLNRQEWRFGSEVAGWDAWREDKTRLFWTYSESNPFKGTALLPSVPEAIKAWRVGSSRVLAVSWRDDTSTQIELIVWSDAEPVQISAATVPHCSD